MVFDDVTIVGTGGTTLEAVLAVNQVNEVLQAIQITLAIVTFLVTIAYTIWKWYKNAKKKDSDGGEEITPKELEDLAKQLKETKDNDRD